MKSDRRIAGESLAGQRHLLERRFASRVVVIAGENGNLAREVLVAQSASIQAREEEFAWLRPKQVRRQRLWRNDKGFHSLGASRNIKHELGRGNWSIDR